MTEILIKGALWLAIGTGACALLWLFAEGVEWCAEEFDKWQDAVFTNYLDD